MSGGQYGQWLPRPSSRGSGNCPAITLFCTGVGNSPPTGSLWGRRLSLTGVQPMRIPSIRTWLPALLCSVLAACGGGGSASSSVTSTDVVATGAITGFGSVYVNGIHFETEGADITRDGSPSPQSDLRVGQM